MGIAKGMAFSDLHLPLRWRRWVRLVCLGAYARLLRLDRRVVKEWYTIYSGGLIAAPPARVRSCRSLDMEKETKAAAIVRYMSNRAAAEAEEDSTAAGVMVMPLAYRVEYCEQ